MSDSPYTEISYQVTRVEFGQSLITHAVPTVTKLVTAAEVGELLISVKSR